MNIERIRELVELYNQMTSKLDQTAYVQRDVNKILEAIVAEILKEIASV